MSETTTTDAGVSAYDAAKDSKTRSSFVMFPTNSRRELTPYTRREIVKKHRALEANCAFLTRLIRKSARHAIVAPFCSPLVFIRPKTLRILSVCPSWSQSFLRVRIVALQQTLAHVIH